MKRRGAYHGFARRYIVLRVGLTGTLGLWWCLPAGHAQKDPKTSGEEMAGASLALRGEFASPRRMTGAELQRLPRTEVRTRDVHDGDREALYSGVLLADVLKAGGLFQDPGMAAARDTVRASLLVEAADGYKVVFALAELDPALTDRVVLLADTKDGRPLRTEEGPWRLVVPGDKRPTRWVRQVTALTVRRD